MRQQYIKVMEEELAVGVLETAAECSRLWVHVASPEGPIGGPGMALYVAGYIM